MNTVWKYPLTTAWDFGPQTHRVPEGGEVVGVDRDPTGAPAVWVLVDTEAPIVDRTFAVTGTGHPVPSGGRHCGLLVIGPFVWHVWDMGEAR